VTIYNTVVPAMLAVDPTIKLSAIEYSDYGLGTGDGGDPMTYLPTVLAPANAGGVNAQVDIVSTHFYSTCNQSDTDATLMSTVPGFAANVSYFYKELQTRPDLKDVPVWVTENNVNADYQGANGMSTCNPNQVFVDDHRGTSAFFAAWRPYVFSQLGKVGNQALYHWSYDADQQYGEVDGSGNTYLSYWVDQTLKSLYPSTPSSPGPEILQLAATDSTTVETLATENADGSVVVMVDDRAVASPTDNNGSGSARTVVVDLSGLGSFTSASLLTIDAINYFYDFPELAFLALACWIAIEFNWWWLIPVCVLGTWNKESFLLFIPTLYPFIRGRVSRKQAWIGTSVLLMAALTVYLPIHMHFKNNPGGTVLLRLDRQILVGRQLWGLFAHDTTYGILTLTPFNPFFLALITWTAWRGWSLLPKMAQGHARIALAINIPLYILFCEVGELRDLSFLYVTLLLLIAQNLRTWNGDFHAPGTLSN
jgi:hypothetical protein